MPAESATQDPDAGLAPLPPVHELSTASATALAWALKDRCQAAWNSDPQKAVPAAAQLRQLRDALEGSTSSAALGVINALTAWTTGIVHAVQGEMEAAIGCLDQAAGQFEVLQLGLPAAQTQVPKIMALAMLGRHEEAAACALQAKQALLVHGDPVAASKVALNLGHLYMEADRYGEALPCFEAAVAGFKAVGDVELTVMADVGVADALTAQGRFDDAANTYAAAAASALSQGLEVLQALIEQSRALLDLVRGQYHKALAGLEASRRRYAALEMPQNLAIAHKQLADAYLELRLLPEARAGHSQALQRFEVLGMQVERAWTLVQLGRGLALAGEATPAQQALEQAAEVFAGLDNQAGAGAVALAQAEMAMARSDSDAALQLATAAAACFAQTGLLERCLRAQVLKAQALSDKGQHRTAAALLDATMHQAQEAALLPVSLRGLVVRAQAALRTGAAQEARADLEVATKLFERLQQTLPGDELRSAFQADQLWPFQALLGLDLSDHETGQLHADAVLTSLDRFRASALADRMGHQPLAAEASVSPVGSRSSDDLRARLAWLYRRLSLTEVETHASAALTAELRQAESDLLERSRRDRLVSAGTQSLRRTDGLDPDLLRALLQPKEALVEYGVHDDELFACLVTTEGVQVHRRLAVWAEVTAAVRAFRYQIESLRHGTTHLQQHMALLERRVQSHLQKLHRLLWLSLVPTLAHCHRVLVVPHGALGLLPFAALTDGSSCLADQLELALAPSARIALEVLSRPDRNISKALVVADTAGLPHAAREAQLVQQWMPNAHVLLGEDATLPKVMAHAGQAELIHLACHGQFRADNPSFSSLQLFDQPWSAESIEGLGLRAAMVVLSGCETAVSDTRVGDEMFGLTRAFLVAGADRVMASLWPVSDETTCDFMGHYYAALVQSRSPASALRAAQLAIRCQQAHAFHWASFTLVGRW